MSTPENEAGAAPSPGQGDGDRVPAQSTPIGEDVEHHHDITDEDLPQDLQPTEDNPLAQGPFEDEDVSAFEGQPEPADDADDAEAAKD